ncbi:organic cation/carnitine transporter 3 [Prunus dulcis]|uniref:Organic cation/carnitine transporter 3 n=1 Tax=Prunus dulcis TaxID=3755 RepID=A0A4Y1RFR0_PRUDU|nr:organic cation/carnitine transporter 3 [Prunus dulcis]
MNICPCVATRAGSARVSKEIKASLENLQTSPVASAVLAGFSTALPPPFHGFRSEKRGGLGRGGREETFARNDT